MIITLTTDFGSKDPFVGQMKGVILSINPAVVLVDITHEIAPQGIEEAAFIVGSSFRYFPGGTVHLAVVDPGVGSARRAIVLEAGGHFFVGPDNGIFSYVLAENGPSQVIRIDTERFSLKPESPTFQGRDLFAPVAARLSTGMRPADFGTPVDDPTVLRVPRPVESGGSLRGEIIHIDRFGNCITSVRSADLVRFGDTGEVFCAGRVVRMVRYYGEAAVDELCCLVNSSGHLELFLNRGDAAAAFRLRRGEGIDVTGSNR